MLPSPEEAKKLRFKYLYEVYKVAMENAENSRFERHKFAVDKYEVGDRLNLSRNTVDNIVEYLYQEGLVYTFKMSGSRGIGGYSGIYKIEPTHKGIKEIEEAVEKPDSPTEHFPPNSVSFCRCALEKLVFIAGDWLQWSLIIAFVI